MSNVNEPEGALKLAAGMLKSQIRVTDRLSTQVRQMSELLGATIVLVEILNEIGNEDGRVVLTGPDSSETPVAEHIENLRRMLLTGYEMAAAVTEQQDGARMLYERFLRRYTDDDGAGDD